MSTTILQQRLQTLKTQGLERQLYKPQGIDLSSSDYLGFSQDATFRQQYLQRLTELTCVGATASRLLRGNLELFEATENLLAQFVNRETALIFPSGYQANLALFSALLREGDIVFSDSLNHASIIDGIRLSRAEKIIYPHRDYQYLEEKLRDHHAENRIKIIVSESLFSMEATLANLTELVHLAQEYGALLVIDEAHSTGMWGPSLVTSQGLGEHVFATIHTGGKALGIGGAWIAGSALLRQYLVNVSRPLIFSTATIPALAILMQEALKFYQLHGRSRAANVLDRAKQLRQQLAPWVMSQDETPIIPLYMGDNNVAVTVSKNLQQRGWDVRAIRPPTVPQGTARLRVTVKWENSLEELRQFADDFKEYI